ncbi:MAG: ankyrin repeat domain-containing protein [Armatimonadetes bacterium]|nr:ankyrin repeat domain-containing protein [Armatimonadota bacterium]
MLSNAVARGDIELVRSLLEHGANVNVGTDDGNTPLHIAAFLCRTEIVQLLLEKGAAPLAKNNRKETPIDVVSGAWSKPLGEFYAAIASSEGYQADLKRIEEECPQIAKMLRAKSLK